MRGFAAQHLLPGERDDIQLVPGQIHRKSGAGGVADGQAFAVGGNPIAIGHLHAAGGAVPHKHRVMGGIVLAEIGDFAIRRLEDTGVFEFELLHRVGDPVFGKTFPGKQVHRAGAQKRPQRHLDGAGIGGRHNAQPVIGGQAQKLLGAVDRILELGFAGFGAVGASHQRAFEGFCRPARPLGAGSGRKKRPRGTHSRENYISHRGSFLPE